MNFTEKKGLDLSLTELKFVVGNSYYCKFFIVSFILA